MLPAGDAGDGVDLRAVDEEPEEGVGPGGGLPPKNNRAGAVRVDLGPRLKIIKKGDVNDVSSL